MVFFKSKPNVPDGEKARIEFYLQQIVDSIGLDRLQLPVWSLTALSDLYESETTPDQIINIVGEHLAYDVTGLAFDVMPEQLEKCGGGG